MDNLGQESAELGIDLDALDNFRLRRISKSDSVRIKKQVLASKMNRIQNSWGWDLMRAKLAEKYKRGRLARFGGGHMLRSGKRSLQEKDNSNPIVIEDLRETEPVYFD